MEAELRAWYTEATKQLATRSNEVHPGYVSGEWQALREEERTVLRRDFNWRLETWSPLVIEQLQTLPSWPVAMKAVEEAAKHLLTGGIRFSVPNVCASLLPPPDEILNSGDHWNRVFADFSAIISSKAWVQTIWPLCDLKLAVPHMQLDADVVLDDMSLNDVRACLNFGSLVPQATRVLVYEAGQMGACVRYTGGTSFLEPDAPHAGLLEALQGALAVALPQVVVNGEMEFACDQNLFGDGSYSRVFAPGGAFPSYRIQESDQHDFKMVWQLVRRLTSQEKIIGIRSALRRMAKVPVPVSTDEAFLDLMMAAEALYLSDIGSDRGELGYRLSLRAAIYANTGELGYGRLSVMKLMKAGYKIRSVIAHGGTPTEKDFKLDGAQLTISELGERIRSVLVQAFGKALRESSEGCWPPNWDELLLSDQAMTT